MPESQVPGCERMVDPRDFRRLLLSRRSMVRENRRTEGLLGLRDRDTGELFLTEERKLRVA